MRAPGFWWRPPGLASTLLAPAAAVYDAVARRRLGQPGRSVAVPVVCIGNMTVGGTGKTPAAIAVADVLRRSGFRPAFLTRGYGGSLSGPVAVDAARHGPAEVGDEALLLAREGLTIVSRDRPAGAEAAMSLDADVIVMDDGLQNPSLAKTLAVAVFDAERGVGNGRTLPAGPLRASMARQWGLADAAILVGTGPAGGAVATEAERHRRPVLRARLVPDPGVVDRLAGRRVLAFAGIGHPDKFFRTCREAGMAVEATRAFPDHHPFSARELSALLDEAERAGLVPVTTAKDGVRLAIHAPGEPRLPLVQTLPVTARFADPDGLARLLDARVGAPGALSRPS